MGRLLPRIRIRSLQLAALVMFALAIGCESEPLEETGPRFAAPPERVEYEGETAAARLEPENAAVIADESYDLLRFFESQYAGSTIRAYRSFDHCRDCPADEKWAESAESRTRRTIPFPKPEEGSFVEVDGVFERGGGCLVRIVGHFDWALGTGGRRETFSPCEDEPSVWGPSQTGGFRHEILSADVVEDEITHSLIHLEDIAYSDGWHRYRGTIEDLRHADGSATIRTDRVDVRQSRFRSPDLHLRITDFTSSLQIDGSGEMEGRIYVDEFGWLDFQRTTTGYGDVWLWLRDAYGAMLRIGWLWGSNVWGADLTMEADIEGDGHVDYVDTIRNNRLTFGSPLSAKSPIDVSQSSETPAITLVDGWRAAEGWRDGPVALDWSVTGPGATPAAITQLDGYLSQVDTSTPGTYTVDLNMIDVLTGARTTRTTTFESPPDDPPEGMPALLIDGPTSALVGAEWSASIQIEPDPSWAEFWWVLEDGHQWGLDPDWRREAIEGRPHDQGIQRIAVSVFYRLDPDDPASSEEYIPLRTVRAIRVDTWPTP
jgi:hypothetical protein